MTTEIVPMVYVRHRELSVGASKGGVVGLNKSTLIPFNWEGEVAQKITDYGLKCREGMKGSIDSAGMASLINKYLLSQLGKARLTRGEQIIFENVFEEKGRRYGNFVNTLVNYNDHCNEREEELEPREGFSRVSVILRPKDFRCNDENQAEFELGDDSKIVRGVYVPGEGFMALTEKGFLNPRTGLPYLTFRDKRIVVESWTSKGFQRDFVEETVSYFLPRNEGQGVGAVGRRFFDRRVFGRFGIGANFDPGISDKYFGRLASR